MVTSSLHNQVREVREVDNIKEVNSLLQDRRWIFMGSSVI